MTRFTHTGHNWTNEPYGRRSPDGSVYRRLSERSFSRTARWLIPAMWMIFLVCVAASCGAVPAHSSSVEVTR